MNDPVTIAKRLTALLSLERCTSYHTWVQVGWALYHTSPNLLDCFRQSLVTLIRAGVYAFRDRRVRKREFRKLWIVRINAACRMRGMRYSQLIHGLQKANVALNRQTLAEIAIHDPATFDKVVEMAKSNL